MHAHYFFFLTVKYEVPRGISMSWSQNNLTLSWTVVEGHPALAEVRYRRNEHPTESWEYVSSVLLPQFSIRSLLCIT